MGIAIDITATRATNDAIVAGMLHEALGLLGKDRATALRRIEDARELMCHEENADRARFGHLASWQMRRAEKYILSHLDERQRIGSVATIVNLSSSYFSRAFKATKGMSYSDYVLGARIALAKDLLTTTEASIAQIALSCGLADQSHLTRLFSKAEGVPPRAWRCRRVADGRNSPGRGILAL